MDKLNKEFQALASKVEDFCKKQEMKADLCGDNTEMQCYIDDLNYCVRSISNQLQYLWQAFQDHMKGHLPAVKSTEQLQRAIDVLGLGDEYDVQKQTVYARRGIFVVG